MRDTNTDGFPTPAEIAASTYRAAEDILLTGMRVRLLMRDRDGTGLHVGANVAVFDAPQHRGIIGRLKRIGGHDFAHVDTAEGSHFDIETCELLFERICPSCRGAGGAWRLGPRGLGDPQTVVQCDACEGSGVIGAV